MKAFLITRSQTFPHERKNKGSHRSIRSKFQHLCGALNIGKPRHTILRPKLRGRLDMREYIGVVQRPNLNNSSTLKSFEIGRLVDCTPTIVTEMDSHVHTIFMDRTEALRCTGSDFEIVLW